MTRTSPQFRSRGRALRIASLLLVVIGLVTMPRSGAVVAQPNTAPQLFLLPSRIAPRGELRVSGAYLSPQQTYSVSISGPLTRTITLGEVTAGPTGTLEPSTMIVEPDLAPGNYTVALSTGRAFRVATAPLVLSPPPEVQLTPAEGPPGTLVMFRVTNLLAGRLRLDFDGAAVAGPLNVEEGTYAGVFIVPRDRPVVPGTLVGVQARNFVDTQVVGEAFTSFQTREDTGTPRYQLTNIVLPDTPLEPGAEFSISGKISPSPALGSDVKLMPLWKNADNRVVPIDLGPARITGDGTFELKARLPDIYGGDAQNAGVRGEVGVALLTPSAVLSPPSWNEIGVTPGPRLSIRLVNEQGQPIPNAVVGEVHDDQSYRGSKANFPPTIPGQPTLAVIGVSPAADAPGDPAGGGADPLAVIAGGSPNQMQSMIAANWQTQPAEGCAFFNQAGKTDANGEFTFSFDPEQLNKTMTIIGDASAGGTIGPFQTTVGVKGHYGIEVLGNAVPMGYGTIDENGLPRAIDILRTLEYRSNGKGAIDSSEGYFFIGTNIKPTLPLEIVMPRLEFDPPGFLDDPTLLYRPSPLSPEMLWKFQGPNISLRNVQGASLPPPNPGVEAISLGFNRGNAGVYQAAELFIKRPGEPEVSIGSLKPYDPTMRFRPGDNILCTPTNGLIVSLPDQTWRFFAPGDNQIRASIKLANIAQPFEKTWTFHYDPPPAWFANPSSPMQRSLVDGRESIRLYGRLTPPAADKSATVPSVGPLKNEAGGNTTLKQEFHKGGTNGLEYTSSIPITALNRGSERNDAYKQNGETLVIPNQTIELFNTGRVPLFRAVWGVWPIASATLGADIWFSASLTYGGKILLQGGQPTSTTLSVFPQATVGVEIFLDVSALFGIIHASASAVPEINVCMPVTFTDGKRIPADMRFRYKLDVKYEASVGFCPVCLSASGTKNIFNGGDPPCPGASLNGLQPAANDAPVPSLSPSIATDGYGHTAIVYKQDDSLRLRVTGDGHAWNELAEPVTRGKAVDRPQITAYAPSQQMIVWGQNSLSPEILVTTSLTDALPLQHLAFSTLSGDMASAPQNLTEPGASTGGEGGVVLAGCVAGASRCPANGEVTAVWLRSMSPNLADHQFQLYFSRFAGGTWSTPAPVDPAYPADPAMGPSDGEPALAYRDGTAVVVWSRDADRDLGTIDDRHLWMRVLDGRAAAKQLDTLPAGASSPSLAFTASAAMRLAFNVPVGSILSGNQSSLYVAQQGCDVCPWNAWEVLDPHGRSFRVEHPRLLLGNDDELAIEGRGLGYNANSAGEWAFPEDPPGMATGTGAAIRIPVSGPAVPHQALVSAQGAAPEWEVVAVYDRMAGATHTVAVKLPTIQVPSTLTGATVAADAGGSLEVRSTPDLPEFTVTAVEPSARFPQDGDEIGVDVGLRNDGTSWVSDGQSLEIVATWDAPAGLATPSGRTTLDALEAGAVVTVSMRLAAPSGTLDRSHTLTVTVNPGQAIAEGSAANNAHSTQIGGIPAPGAVRAYSPPQSTLAFLQWDELADPRVAGYRIYRLNDVGERIPAGSSFVPGWVDTRSVTGTAYRYVVTAYTADGAESQPSAIGDLRLGDIGPPRLFLPLIRVKEASGTIIGDGTATSCTEQALDQALARGGTIRFNCGRATIVVSNQKQIRLPTHILGDNLITLSGGGKVSIFKIQSDGVLILDDLVLTDGRAMVYGGALENHGRLILNHTTVQRSSVTGFPDGECTEDPCGGGGIATISGTLELNRSQVIDNDGGPYSGGIHSYFSRLIIKDSVIRGNHAIYSGGGLTVVGSAFMSNTTIADNVADFERGVGGGLLVLGGTTQLVGSSVTHNRAAEQGAGIALSRGDFGAGLLQSRIEISDSSITLNATDATTRTYNVGGGIGNFGGEVQLTRVTLANNTANGGGGLWSEREGASVMISESTVSGNVARDTGNGELGNGGGLALYGAGPARLLNATLSGNTAKLAGGGLFVGNGEVSFFNVTIFGNRAPEGAAIRLVLDATATLQSSVVAGSLDGANCALATTPLQSAGNNLASDSSCGLNGSGDRQGVDPGLKPLANNGGLTQTHLPQASSPLLDQGGAFCAATDQRGVARPAGPACDIGAVEGTMAAP